MRPGILAHFCTLQLSGQTTATRLHLDPGSVSTRAPRHLGWTMMPLRAIGISRGGVKLTRNKPGLARHCDRVYELGSRIVCSYSDTGRIRLPSTVLAAAAIRKTSRIGRTLRDVDSLSARPHRCLPKRQENSGPAGGANMPGKTWRLISNIATGFLAHEALTRGAAIAYYSIFPLPRS